MNELTIRDKNLRIVRDVIEEKRKSILRYKKESNWESVKKFWSIYYGSDFKNSAEEVYQKMKKRGWGSLHSVAFKCEICDEYFGLDEVFIELIIDHGGSGYDDDTFTFHRECVRKL